MSQFLTLIWPGKLSFVLFLKQRTNNKLSLLNSELESSKLFVDLHVKFWVSFTYNTFVSLSTRGERIMSRWMRVEGSIFSWLNFLEFSDKVSFNIEITFSPKIICPLSSFLVQKRRRCLSSERIEMLFWLMSLCEK